jgi:energy-coupling factor transport system permease protein
VAVVVAMTFAPNLVADVRRLRAARRLRGRADKGLRAVLQVGLPVLEGALERSVALAAAMDARGYGRSAEVPRGVRRTTTLLTLGGLLGVCAGSYALLSVQGAAYGLPLLLAGAVLALCGLRLGGRRSVRTRYRPEVWGVRAWLTALSGAAAGAVTVAAGGAYPEALHPPAVPLAAPELPLWPAAGLLLGLLPAFVAPVPALPEVTLWSEATVRGEATVSGEVTVSGGATTTDAAANPAAGTGTSAATATDRTAARTATRPHSDKESAQ